METTEVLMHYDHIPVLFRAQNKDGEYVGVLAEETEDTLIYLYVKGLWPRELEAWKAMVNGATDARVCEVTVGKKKWYTIKEVPEKWRL